MEKTDFNFKSISSTAQLVDETIKFNRYLEPELTKEEALNRYEELLKYVKEQMELDKDKEGVGDKYFILAIQDFMNCCALCRFYPYMGAILVNCTIDSAKRIDLDEFCSGVVTYLNECLKHNKWIMSRNIHTVESMDDIVTILDEEKDNESDIRYN
jgi:hypothetical protein